MILIIDPNLRKHPASVSLELGIPRSVVHADLTGRSQEDGEAKDEEMKEEEVQKEGFDKVNCRRFWGRNNYQLNV